jgi:hypothetical protein
MYTYFSDIKVNDDSPVTDDVLIDMMYKHKTRNLEVIEWMKANKTGVFPKSVDDWNCVKQLFEKYTRENPLLAITLCYRTKMDGEDESCHLLHKGEYTVLPNKDAALRHFYNLPKTDVLYEHSYRVAKHYFA